MQLTSAEKLLYSTIKLTCSANGAATSTGTGFFMRFHLDEDYETVAIITNKHVLEGAKAVTAVCHIAEDNAPSGKFVPCTVPVDDHHVIYHPSPDVDLCAVLFTPILLQAREAGTPLFFASVELDLIPREDQWQYFDAIETVTMIGCPRGISDEANNLPIVRRGITASALSKGYNGKPEFMVDMACFPGSSGSPIFIFDRDGYFDREKSVYAMGKERLLLVGILYSGPLVSNDGKLILGQVPRVAVQTMMHLGNALRSSAIFGIRDVMNQRVSSLTHQER